MNCKLLLRVVRSTQYFFTPFSPGLGFIAKRIIEHDHVVGVSISIRFNTQLISVWNKLGSNERSVKMLEKTIMDRLSPGLMPKTFASSSPCFYKRHAEHDGFQEAVDRSKSSEE